MSSVNLDNIKEINEYLININDIYKLSQTTDSEDIRKIYREFILKSLNDFFLKTEFNGLYSYMFGDYDPGDPNYKGLNITCCKIPEDKINTYLDAFYNKFLAFPLFWKDYICMFYIALKQFSKIKDNSRIICLGESPMKIVFIQEFFLKNENIKKSLIDNNYSTNVSFDYFSMSRLQTGISTLYPSVNIKQKYSNLYTLFMNGNFLEINTKIIEMFIKKDKDVLEYLTDGGRQKYKQQALDKIYKHFSYWKLNPRYILEQKKPVYFEDRCESYASVLGLIYHYIQLCNKEGFTREERKQLYTLLYIVGFDHKDESNASYKEDESKLYVINYLMYYLFCSPIPGKAYEDLSEEEKKNFEIEALNLEFDSITKNKLEMINYHFIQINYYNSSKYKNGDDQNVDEYFIEEIGKDLFFNQKDSLKKNIIFLTLPEFGINSTRCIQGVNLYTSGSSNEYNDITYDEVTNVKQQGEPGINCNLFNFFIIYYLNKLASTPNSILIDMISYFKTDSVDEQEIFNNSTYNQDIFGTLTASKTWWEKTKTRTNEEYKKMLIEYKEKILKNLEYEEDNNYFKNLIKLIDIQRIIGTIRLGTTITDADLIYRTLANPESTIPLTSNVKSFVYNEEYKKMWKNKEVTSTGGLNRNKFFKKHTRKQTRKQFQKKRVNNKKNKQTKKWNKK
jgi:hypothetical protein